MTLLHRIISLRYGQRGSATILFILCMPVLLGFAALAVDLARLGQAKAELQNSADAAALAGARSLGATQPPPGPSDTPYHWSAATATALGVARHNIANGAQIQDALIETGYWNLQNPSLGLRPPGTPGVPATGDLPAVRATVAVSSTQNNGPLPFFFAPILGIDESDIQASAVAVLPSPGGGTGIFPFVINKPMFDNYWDPDTNKPINDPATGEPYVLDYGSKIKYNDKISGTWTAFDIDDPDDCNPCYIKGFVPDGNTDPLYIGDQIWVSPDPESSSQKQKYNKYLYKNVPKDTDIAVFVVDDITTDSWQEIYAIAVFHVDDVYVPKKWWKGDSYITGHFVENVSFSGLEPGVGPLYGAYSRPVLVK